MLTGASSGQRCNPWGGAIGVGRRLGSIRFGWLGLAAENIVRPGGVDVLLTDVDFLVHAHPKVVAPLLSEAGGEEETVRAWDLTTGQQVGSELAFPMLPVNAVAVTSHGDLVVGYGFEVALLTRSSRQH